VTGEAVDRAVTLHDRFQVQPVVVGPPVLFCVPVDKNGEGVLVPPTEPLICCGTEPAGAAPGAVAIANQLPEAELDVGPALGLCVPSLAL
jgi:hypothetical protein